jgi:predicted TIM-barrel fold metal-dependent hydrolase
LRWRSGLRRATIAAGTFDPEASMNYIDAHIHVWTDDTTHYPLGAGWRPEDMEPRRFTPEDWFRHARPAGVNRAVLIQMSYYYPREGADPAAVREHATSRNGDGFDNRYMLDMMGLHRDVFAGTAVIDPLAAEPDRRMAELARQRVRAFRIHPRLSRQPAARWLQPEGYATLFATGARLNVAMSCLIDPDGLPELDRMCRRYPDTPVIIDHLSRIGADGTVRDRDVDALCAMAEHRRVLVKVGAFYALGRRRAPHLDLAPMIERVVRAFGPRRCMWESDCPFQVAGEHTYRDSIDLVRTRLTFLSDEDRDWLLRRTAEAFFFTAR